MSHQPPPSENPPIFNPPNWQIGDDALTLEDADTRYLKLSGGTERGIVFFDAGLDTATITNGAATLTMPSTTGTLAITSQTVNLAGTQTITGTKTFSAAPSIATINNGSFVGTMPSSASDSGTFVTTASTTNFAADITFTGPGGSSLGANTIYVNPASSAAGTATNWYYSAFKDPSISSGTVTNAYTVYISGAPTGGTITNPFAFTVASGTSWFQGLLRTTAVSVDSGSSITLTSGQVVSTAGGTAAAPAFALSGATGMGMYSDAANTIKFATSSGNRMSVGNGSVAPQVVIRGVTGTAAAPSYSYSIDAASGMYIVAISNIALAVAGTKVMDYTSTKTSVVVAGSAATPSFGFSTDTGTGLYRPAADQIGMAISGVNLFTFSSTGATLSGGQIISSSNGSASAPPFSVGGTNCGMYAGASNQLNFSVNGSNKFTITTASNTFTQQFRSSSGTVSAPGISFSSDNTSGLYLIGAGNPALAISSVKLIEYASTGAIITGNFEINGGYLVGNTFFNAVGESVVVTSKTNSSTGTGCLQITPSSSGWAAGGTSKLIFGDAGHNITVAHSTGMTIEDVDSIKFSPSGSTFKIMRRGSYTMTAPGANFATFTVAHGLGTTPIHADATVDKNGFSANNECFSATIQSWDGTNIVWQICRVDTNSNWSNDYALRWMAYA